MLRLTNTQHFITVVATALVAAIWGSGFVWKILEAIWPVAAAAVLVFITSAALAGSLHVLALGVRSFRPAAVPFEVIPPDTAMHTFTRSVRDAITPEHSEHAHRDRWNAALLQFVFVGDLDGLAVQKLLPYISRSKREVFVRLMTDRNPPIMLSDHEGTRWAPGWNRHVLRMALKHGLIELPYPAGDPPAVNLSRLVKHAQHTQHARPNTPGTGVVYLSPMRQQ